jgi:hypothetical protein
VRDAVSVADPPDGVRDDEREYVADPVRESLCDRVGTSRMESDCVTVRVARMVDDGDSRCVDDAERVGAVAVDDPVGESVIERLTVRVGRTLMELLTDAVFDKDCDADGDKRADGVVEIRDEPEAVPLAVSDGYDSVPLCVLGSGSDIVTLVMVTVGSDGDALNEPDGDALRVGTRRRVSDAVCDVESDSVTDDDADRVWSKGLVTLAVVVRLADADAEPDGVTVRDAVCVTAARIEAVNVGVVLNDPDCDGDDDDDRLRGAVTDAVALASVSDAVSVSVDERVWRSARVDVSESVMDAVPVAETLEENE